MWINCDKFWIMCKCANVQMCKCANVQMCIHVQMCTCDKMIFHLFFNFQTHIRTHHTDRTTTCAKKYRTTISKKKSAIFVTIKIYSAKNVTLIFRYRTCCHTHFVCSLRPQFMYRTIFFCLKSVTYTFFCVWRERDLLRAHPSVYRKSGAWELQNRFVLGKIVVL